MCASQRPLPHAVRDYRNPGFGARTEPRKGGMVKAVGHLTQALPYMGSFTDGRRLKLQQTEAALPDIFKARHRTGQWNVLDEGPILLRAYIAVFELVYRQNRLLAETLRGDLAFERIVAAKMRTAVKSHRVACSELLKGKSR